MKFICAFAALFFASCSHSSEGVVNVSVDKAGIIIENKNPDLRIIDVRTPAEYAEGHIPGAQLININDASFDILIKKLDKTKQYLVYCRSGSRSAKAASRMAAAGFTSIINMEGGFLEWKDKGYPYEK